MRLRHKAHEVVVALVRLRQQQQVIQARLDVGAQALVVGEVDLAAVDGLDVLARLFLDRRARVGQLRHAAHDAVVGDGHGGHVELCGAPDHVLYMRCAVEQGIFGMVVQMYECHNVPLVRLRPAAQRGAPFRRKCRTPPVGFAPSRAQELSRSTPHDTSVHEDGHRTKHGDSQVLAMRMPARPADAKTDASLALRFPEGSFATLPQTARHGLARQQHVTPPIPGNASSKASIVDAN